MKTYVRMSLKLKFIEFPKEIDSEYWEGKIGRTYIDYLNDKWIPLSSSLISFWKSHPMASPKEVIEMYVPQPAPRSLSEAKNDKIGSIVSYDNSEEVNSFLIKLSNEATPISMWFTSAERANHKNSIDSAETLGLETISVPVGGIDIEVPLLKARIVLAQVQLYADTCYKVTLAHIAAVLALDSIEAVDAYDYTTGYPEKILFNLND